MGSSPIAVEHAVVHSRCGRARITVLTDRLVRLEWSPVGRFENRASQAIINRNLQPPEFIIERAGGELRISTSRLRILLREDGKAFHSGNLRIEGSVADRSFSWFPGADPIGNLGGTTRTLDNINGRCPIEPGILSRDGWALIDDSSALVFDPAHAGETGGVEAQDWITPREVPGATDWYFFGHGRDFAGALREFTLIAGRIPLPPRFVFGSWWSRYWAYDEDELIALVREFREHDVPIDVLVIDMDWHLDGWTGYTWNPRYFPDPQRFLDWTSTHGLQISLNLHPADGVGRHEAAFEPMCRELGLDPRSTERIPFDCTDRRFVGAYFRHLHWPIESQGVGFWWMDWQQGTTTNLPGLDPLWWLNHLHWKDLEIRADPSREVGDIRRSRRPLIFSRWGGLGNHRYPIGFSGDTFSTWGSLAWQPEFTATAGNVGYAYWSHDIGGHQPGPVDPELYVRWVQFGVLSPILRTHTSKNPQGERRIWASREREFKAMREAFRLRYRLIPYLYASARRTHDESLPLCRPMYYHWPEEANAYAPCYRNQYMLGDDLLAAPVVSPGDRAGRCAEVEVWIPPGVWTNWNSGETIEGPANLRMNVPIEEIPLFARGGAIIPAAQAMKWSNERPLDPLSLIVWPDATADERGETVLYEDDGESIGYLRGEIRRTPIRFRRDANVLRLTIGPASGAFNGMSNGRGYEIRLVDRWPARSVAVDGIGVEVIVGDAGPRDAWSYDEAKLTIVVRLSSRPIRDEITIEVTLDDADEGPLRRGVHGGAKLLESLGSLLGERAPPTLRDAAAGELRRSIIASRGAGLDAEVITDEERWRLALEINRSDAPDAIRREAVCRLLGLKGSIRVQSHPRDPGKALAEAHAEVLNPNPAIIIEVTLHLPDGLLATGRGRATCDWPIPSPPEYSSIRADIALTRGDERLTLSMEDAVFPSINAWWAAGPFPCSFSEAMKTPFGPELAERCVPSANDNYRDSLGTNIGWRRVTRTLQPGDDPHDEFVVDLHQVFGGHHDHAVAYAMTVIHSESESDVTLALGSDDGMAVWLNGAKVFEQDVQRGYGSRQDAVPLRLRPGRNNLLLKITQAVGMWAFGAHLLGSNGLPPRGVRVMLDA